MHSSLIRANLKRPLRPISISSGLAAGWLLLYPPIALALSSRTATRSRYTPRSLSAPAPTIFSTRLMSSSSEFNSDGGSSSTLASKWSDVLADTNGIHWNYANSLFPPLTASSHKGSHGRIAIFGGSEKYTGAPYYAAQSALHCGIDLATIFCAKEASVPIKCYSPELMVQAVYSVEELDVLLKEERGLLQELEQCRQRNDLMTNEMNKMELAQTMEKLEHSEEKQHLLIQSELNNDDKMEVLVERLAKMKSIEEKLQVLRDRQELSVGSIVDTITSMFPALHTLCIGPGLGRHPLVFSAVKRVILKAIESNLTLVLDADALFMLSLKEYRSVLEMLRNYERCVMTPNLMEMRRLDEAISGGSSDSNESHHNIIVQKGNVDKIESDCSTMLCEEEGGLKRSGGIGDVLAGTISAFMAWNSILEPHGSKDSIGGEAANQKQRMFAAWTACVAVKRATKISYQKKRRAMSALDVSREIGEVLSVMEGGLKLEHVCNQMQHHNK